jgi:hypothetical protein
MSSTLPTNSAADATEPALRPPVNLVSPRAVRFWFARAATAWVIVLAAQVVSWRLDWSLPPWHVPLLASG